MEPIIAPSILSADFARLGEEVRTTDCTPWLHVDVMDGLFVPNISLGVPVVQSLCRCTGHFLDVHLMIHRPVRYILPFAQAGADLLSIHLEADTPEGIRAALDAMEQAGVKKAVALKPNTPAEAVLPWLSELDMVLVMTVEPGFGGQKFMDSQLDTIRQVRRYIDQQNPACRLEVDGGIDPTTISLAHSAGADTFVAGSAVFGKEDRAAALEGLRGACHG